MNPNQIGALLVLLGTVGFLAFVLPRVVDRFFEERPRRLPFFSAKTERTRSAKRMTGGVN